MHVCTGLFYQSFSEVVCENVSPGPSLLARGCDFDPKLFYKSLWVRASGRNENQTFKLDSIFQM